YQDVEEILSQGIDVYTTLNIQHIESLNDVVAQITRIHVRETVPDKLLDEASEIELVDTTPEDLIARLREGKVYVKAQAERALKHFFSPGNLNALRELALRRTALRVDRDVGEYTQARAIGGPAGASWSASTSIRPRRNWCAAPSASPTISRRRGRRSMSRGRGISRSPRPRRTASPTRCAWRNG